MTSLFQRTRDYLKTHQRQVSVGALLFGFIWDSITLGAPDSIFNNAVFITYLVISAGCILLAVIYEKNLRELPIFLLPLMQFSFGNLAGGLFVVYGQSGNLEGSAIFFLLLFGFILANELVMNYYAKLSFNIAAWYFLLFAYLAIIVPILIGTIGNLIFLLSGILSLVTVLLFLYLLRSVSYEKVVHERKLNILLIGSIFILFNVLYFSRLIPPVPLSLSDIGIYHSLVKLADGNYSATYEKPKWWQFTKSTSPIFTKTNSSAYCFSSVFAPGRLASTGIYHHWEYKNPSSGEWVTKTRVEFPISGGREKGYRGYSLTTDPALGEWRCSVETAYGALIGRVTFTVVGTTEVKEFSYTKL